MLSEKFDSNVNQEKRKKFFMKFNQEEVNLLLSSNDNEYLAKEFDKIFLKLLRLIKYSSDRNKETKSELQQDSHKLLKKFTNFVKNRAINLKIINEQEYFFRDICTFLNLFEGDSYFSKIHNSIGPTSLIEYHNKTFGDQMFHNMYGRERGLEKSCEGGSCSYWTLILYKFFSKLKEAGLDLNIKFYRYKNMEDEIAGSLIRRHSGLIITFQGKDHLIDYEGIQKGGGTIAKPIQSFINIFRENGLNKDAKILENFKHKNQKETEQIIFFDNVNDFISHIKKFPEAKRISLYVKIEDRVEPVKFDYLFNDTGIQIGLNDRYVEFILKDNKLNRTNFIKNFIEKIGIYRDIDGFHYITQHQINDLKNFMNIIEDKIDTNKLYNDYSCGNNRKSELVKKNGENMVVINQI